MTANVNVNGSIIRISVGEGRQTFKWFVEKAIVSFIMMFRLICVLYICKTKARPNYPGANK